MLCNGVYSVILNSPKQNIKVFNITIYALQERHSPHHHKKRELVTRISMSLPTKLLSEFDKSMLKSGYVDRSKALQTAMHSFINNYEWEDIENNEFGAVEQ